jgi:CheY-like chemotaxis protein
METYNVLLSDLGCSVCKKSVKIACLPIRLDNGTFTLMIDEQDSDGDDAPLTPRRMLMKSFAARLHDALDEINFVRGKSRSAALGAALEAERTQGYRMLRGVSPPDLKDLVMLVKLGIPLERIVREIGDLPKRKSVDISVQGGTVFTFEIDEPVDDSIGGPALIPSNDGYKLIEVKPGAKPPEGAIPFKRLEYRPNPKPTLAIVDDDKSVLDLLDQQMSDSFRTLTFNNAQGLLEAISQPNDIRVFLVDWRLPDIDGEELLKKIQQYSKAPIFILTGDPTASQSIAKVLMNKKLHYVAKPVDALILAVRMQNEITWK